jgi:hypothetical protein
MGEGAGVQCRVKVIMSPIEFNLAAHPANRDGIIGISGIVISSSIAIF